MKSKPQGKRKEKERYAGRRMGRWTAGDGDNVGQTKREGEMRVRSSEQSDGGRLKRSKSETQGDGG